MDFDRCDQLFALVRGGSILKEKEKALRELFNACDVLSFEIGRGSIFWRARPCANQQGYSLDADLFHPPTSKTNEGRLNEAGAPVLYLSTREETALVEIGAQAADFAHIAGFRILADATVRFVALGEVNHVINTGQFRSMGQDPGNAIQRMLNGIPVREARIWAYIDAFLADILAKSDKAWYAVTRLITTIAFQKSGAIAMFYPSVRRSLGMNLAISASIATRLHSVTSFVSRVDAVREYGFIDFERVRMVEQVDDDGRFIWCKEVQPGKGTLYRCTKVEFEQGRGSEVSLLDLPAEQKLPGRAKPESLTKAIFRGLRE